MPRRKPLDQVKDRIPALAHRPGEELPTRDRTWDQAHRAFSFRIRPEDAERLATQARELGVSRDALAGGLLQAALDAIDRGWLSFEVGQVVTEAEDKKQRRRVYVRRFVRPAWAAGRIANSDEL